MANGKALAAARFLAPLSCPASRMAGHGASKAARFRAQMASQVVAW
jgi:hypothetical protein